MNQLGKPHGAIGVSQYEGIISPAYFVAHIGDRAHPRFVHYLLRTRRYISEFERRGKFMPPSQFDISWEQFRSIPVALPTLSHQQAIADFLEAETARIDALIIRKRQLIDLLEKRFWAEVALNIANLNADVVPLRRVIEGISDGPFGSSLTSSHYSDQGARVVRLGNIGLAQFKNEDKAFIPLNHYAELMKHDVREGELLMAGLGDSNRHVGRACVAPKLGKAIVKADCYCIRVDPARAEPQFLALFLSSPIGANQVAVAARGTTRSRINLDIAKEIRVPLAPLESQSRAISIARMLRARTSKTSGTLAAQIELLSEHRQALITAAVTGELEVPGAA